MEKEIYEAPTAALVQVETKDVITLSGIELPDDELE